jgi:hypothetical protein
MATPLPPTVAMLEKRLGIPPGGLTGEDLARAQEALVDATTLVLAEVSPGRAEAWKLDAPPVAVLVALKAARREFDNPRGINQETVGPRSVGLSETSGVYLTAREIAQVRRAFTGRTSGAVGTIKIAPGFVRGSGAQVWQERDVYGPR